MSKVEAGVIGLGNMGRGVAENLARGGVATGVWDVDAARREHFAAIDNAEVKTPGEMAADGATLIFVVPATPEIEACFDGDDGVLANVADGGITVFDLTTSYPADTKRLAARAAEHGVTYLDAAMSGGATGADAGTLTLMIGGDKAAYENALPLLDHFTANLFHLGDTGAGHAMKLIHNMVTHAIFLTNCEAGRLADAAGIDLADMVAVFNASNARSYASEARFPRHILSGKWDARSRVYNLHKDLGMAVRMADELGADHTFASDTLSFLKKAMARGMQEEDYSLLYRDFDAIKAMPEQD